MQSFEKAGVSVLAPATVLAPSIGPSANSSRVRAWLVGFLAACWGAGAVDIARRAIN